MEGEVFFEMDYEEIVTKLFTCKFESNEDVDFIKKLRARFGKNVCQNLILKMVQKHPVELDIHRILTKIEIEELKHEYNIEGEKK